MSNSSSLLQELLQNFPKLRSQMYFKSSLMALSHAMEDLVLSGSEAPLIIASFQRERFYRQETRRYRQLSQRADRAYILTVPEVESGLAIAHPSCETIPLDPSDDLAREWYLVAIGKQYTTCLICREIETAAEPIVDRARRFEGIWSFDRRVSIQAARLLLAQISTRRPELRSEIEQVWEDYGLTAETAEPILIPTPQKLNTEIFAQRLVTYLQASQYRLLNAYRAIADRERQERLINTITSAIRSSLNPQEVLAITVQELAQAFNPCRCLLYPLSAAQGEVEIEYEAVAVGMPALKGQLWSCADNPLFLAAQAQERALAIHDVSNNPYLQDNPALRDKIQSWQICSWLIVPIRHQGTLLGMLELHRDRAHPYQWQDPDIALVEAIATQAGVALTQAQAYSNLAEVNQQLETLERIQSNLIAIVGHELRTPLSTIRVCLESLASEPNIAVASQQVMLDVALADAERLRRLIQDFLTIAKLESDRAYHHPEPIQLQEVLELALSGLKARRRVDLPQIRAKLPPQLPLVKADGEGLVEVFAKLLDNACKFTAPNGEITVRVEIHSDDSARSPMLEAIVADTGRGIEPSQLEAIFDRFYQEESALQRTVGGTGLGLAICRQIVRSMGGKIWAESAGKEQGSQFHFTIPIESCSPT